MRLMFFSIFKIAFLEGICSLFGLIEAEYRPEGFNIPDGESGPVKTTPLFDRLLDWKE